MAALLSRRDVPSQPANVGTRSKPFVVPRSCLGLGRLVTAGTGTRRSPGLGKPLSVGGARPGQTCPVQRALDPSRSGLLQNQHRFSKLSQRISPPDRVDPTCDRFHQLRRQHFHWLGPTRVPAQTPSMPPSETRVGDAPAVSVRVENESLGGSGRGPARPGILVVPAHVAPDSQMFPRPLAASRRSLVLLPTACATSGRRSLRRADCRGKESQDPPDRAGSVQGRPPRPYYPFPIRCRPFAAAGRQAV